MSTLWEEIYEIFWDKIQKDKGFFMYNNISPDEALELAKKRSKSLMKESISRLTLSCTPDVDFQDYNEESESFNFNCTNNEKDLVASIMREKLFDKDKSLLKAFEVRFSPKDLDTFSPSAERKTFLEMVSEIVKENNKAIKNYSDRDRLTGQFKKIDYSKYNC